MGKIQWRTVVCSCPSARLPLSLRLDLRLHVSLRLDFLRADGYGFTTATLLARLYLESGLRAGYRTSLPIRGVIRQGEASDLRPVCSMEPDGWEDGRRRQLLEMGLWYATCLADCKREAIARWEVEPTVLFALHRER